jgi:hypothetical protein
MKRTGISLPLLFSFATAAFLASCSPSGDGGDKKAAQVEKKLQEAQDLKDEAVAAGADKIDPEEWESAVKKIDDAKELVDAGKSEKAASKISTASRSIRGLIDKLGELKKTQGSAADARKKAEKSIADARKRKDDVDAPDDFDAAMKTYEQAIADLSDPKKASGAGKKFDAVLEALRRAKSVAADNRKDQERATEAQTAAKAMQGKAVEAKVDKLATSEYTSALQGLRDADASFKDKRYRDASDAYARVERDLAAAITLVGTLAGNEGSGGSPPDAGSTPAPVPLVDGSGDEKGKKAKKDDPPPEPVADDSGGEAGKVPPGELSAEDDEFLAKNIGEFTKKSGVAATYDRVSGDFSVEYPYGDQLRKDVVFPFPYDERFYKWKENMGGTLLGSKEAKGQNTNNVGMSFEGNTHGCLLIPIPFKEAVTVEYGLDIGVMTPGHSLSCLLMVSDDYKRALAADFATIEVWKEFKPVSSWPTSNPKCKGLPNRWFSKIRTVQMKIVYKPYEKDPKKAVMEIWYDQSGEEFTEAPITAHLVPQVSGFVGFAWNAVKFKARGLKIAGKLDKQLAVKVLRAKLSGGAKAAAPGPKAAKPAKKADEEGTETASGSDEGAEAPKAPANKKTANAKKADDGGDKKDPVDY